jgi:ABC-type multidrug transport system fused ATPase/permease subunit
MSSPATAPRPGSAAPEAQAAAVAAPLVPAARPGTPPPARGGPGGASLSRAFREIIWPRRRLVLLGLLLIVVNRLSGLVLPASTKYLVDDVLVGERVELLGWLLAAVAVAVTVQAGTSFLLTRLLSVEAQLLIAQLRSEVQRHVLGLPVRSFEEATSGGLVSRIMDDVEGVRNLVGTGLVQLVGGVLTAVVALGFLLRIDPLLTVLAVVPLALFAAVSTRAFQTLRPAFRERGAIRAEVTGRLTEALGGIRVIKGFHAVERESEVFRAGVLRIFANVRKTLTATAAVTSFGTFFMGMAAVLIMGYGGRRILAGDLTVGELFSFTLFLGFLVAPVVQMANIGTQMTEAFAGLDRTAELLAQPREDDDPRRTRVMPTIEGHVSFEAVSFAYQPGKPVLRQVSFEAPPGTVVALVGSSGSGKTTLASLAASFLSPDQGRVLVDGIDLAEVTLASYRRQLGLVLQDDFLFDGTIRENLLFARPGSTPAEVEEAARRAYVLEFAQGLPAGLDTLIGERGVKLSGGQRQRVAIARVILKDAPILVLDEATSALDSEVEAAIQGTLYGVMEGKTVIAIAHRLSTIAHMDRIVVLDDGRIVEQGSHSELLALNGLYARFWNRQSGGFINLEAAE